ncbi:glycosyl transferase family 1 [Nonlabens arenilitoris]|uniref:Glycosyl transferase family 1 n=1 Tax=Nonlabens arenilitoris TaxID=1217969 RepID=A0A2S7UDA7_9FLAO|nr:glycosyl transferase family 1 [Nonlabens arenilitoris]PQJ32936.1 glycosyl transferase family 1 [Nonlabens arenilitoris]
MKNPVLIITYYWPPAGGPGVQRWLKFATYLDQYNFEVTVVIPDHPDYPIVDASLIEEVPKGIQFIKVPINEPSRWASSLSRKRTKNLQKGIIPKNAGPLQRAMIWMRGNLFVPDARVGWKSRVIKAIHPYLLEHKNPTIITTGPPHSIHLIGLELKNKYTGFKWLADFRDPWTTIGYHKHLKIGARAQKKHEQLEQDVLNNADLLIVTSPHTGKEFASKSNTPIQVITNGFDINVNTTTRQPVGAFTMSHVGTLLSDRNPQVLWEVLAELCSESTDFKAAFKLQLAGNVSSEILDSIHRYDLDSNLNLLGYLSHKDAVDLMFHSQCLLLIEIDSIDTKAIIPGKLFEYFASARPIIAIGPKDADIENLIKHTHSGQYFNYLEKQKLKEHVLEKYALFKNGNNEGQLNDHINSYKRENLTKTLAKTIAYTWE